MQDGARALRLLASIQEYSEGNFSEDDRLLVTHGVEVLTRLLLHARPNIFAEVEILNLGIPAAGALRMENPSETEH